MSRYALAARLLSPLFVVVLTARPQLPAHDPITLTDADVRRMLNVEDQLGGEHDQLIKQGPRLFPTYQRLLAARDVTPSEAARIFVTIRDVKGDRTQFIDSAAAALAKNNATLRRAALNLLMQIGSPRDAAPVAVLLSDPDRTIPYHAARTLAAIGDQRSLTAMDIWLDSPRSREDQHLRDSGARFRDELWRRLDKESRERKAPPLTPTPPRP